MQQKERTLIYLFFEFVFEIERIKRARNRRLGKHTKKLNLRGSFQQNCLHPPTARLWGAWLPHWKGD